MSLSNQARDLRKNPLSLSRIADRMPRSSDADFLLAWLKSPLRTGAVTSSSRALATMMADQLDPGGPGAIVELGPGTGPVTRALLERGFSEDRLVLIEYNPEFQQRLRELYPQAQVIGGDAYAMKDLVKKETGQSIGGVVSSLPLLTQPPAIRRALLKDALDLCEPESPFVQFTYGSKSPVPLNDLTISVVPSKRIWWNLPPATVWTYRRKTNGVPSQ